MDMNSDEWRTTNLLVDEELLERMVMAVEKVRERLHRATGALEAATIPYAVADDCAVPPGSAESMSRRFVTRRMSTSSFGVLTWKRPKPPFPRPASFTAMPMESICFSTDRTSGPETPFASSSPERKSTPMTSGPHAM
jgi:hypothetical protein